MMNLAISDFIFMEEMLKLNFYDIASDRRRHSEIY